MAAGDPTAQRSGASPCPIPVRCGSRYRWASVATIVGTLLGIALLVITLPMARRAGRLDGDPATTRLVRWGLVLKLLAAPFYLIVIGRVYGGGDYGPGRSAEALD